jgi:hypothetical protein
LYGILLEVEIYLYLLFYPILWRQKSNIRYQKFGGGYNMIDLGKRKNRVNMLKDGFTEKQIVALYVRFKKYRVVLKVLFEPAGLARF